MRSFLSYLRENKKARGVAVLLSVGVLLILMSGLFGRGGTADDGGVMSLDEYREHLESEIASICSDVEGVGKCRVYITLERGEQNTYKGSSVIETKPPRVLGVTVVCRGADSQAVKAELTEMLCALFDIGANRVAVLKLNS